MQLQFLLFTASAINKEKALQQNEEMVKYLNGIANHKSGSN